jgi:hypothetical protein
MGARGADVIVDNLNDTGDIDGQPKNLIRDLILTSVAQDRWITDPDPSTTAGATNR